MINRGVTSGGVNRVRCPILFLGTIGTFFVPTVVEFGTNPRSPTVPLQFV